MRQLLNFSTIGDIDGGRVIESFNQRLAAIVDDCRDRALLDKPRKLVLSIEIRPIPEDGTANLHGCTVSADINSVLPKTESREFDMRVTAGGLVFNDLSHDDADQLTIDDVGGGKIAGDVGPRAILKKGGA